MIKRKSTTASGSFELKKEVESLEAKQPKRKGLWFNFNLIFYSAQLITVIIVTTLILSLKPEGSSLWLLPFGIILTIVIIAVITAIVNIIVKKGWKRGEQRANTIADWVKTKGLKFRSIKDFGIANRYSFNCLQSNPSYCTDIIEGTFSGRQICAFNYLRDIDEMLRASEEGHPIRDDILGKYILSAVIIETSVKFQRFQPVCIKPESLLDKAAESVGLEDITFESIEFNSQFHVKAKDRRWAYDVVNQATMDLLLASPRFIIEFQDRHVIAYRHKLFDTKDIEDALQLLTGILDNLPKSLFHEKKVGKLWK